MRNLAEAPGLEETNKKRTKITIFQRSTLNRKILKKKLKLLNIIIYFGRALTVKHFDIRQFFVIAKIRMFGPGLSVVDLAQRKIASGRKFPKRKQTQRGAPGWPAARCNLHRVERGEVIDWPPHVRNCTKSNFYRQIEALSLETPEKRQSPTNL